MKIGSRNHHKGAFFLSQAEVNEFGEAFIVSDGVLARKELDWRLLRRKRYNVQIELPEIRAFIKQAPQHASFPPVSVTLAVL